MKWVVQKSNFEQLDHDLVFYLLLGFFLSLTPVSQHLHTCMGGFTGIMFGIRFERRMTRQNKTTEG